MLEQLEMLEMLELEMLELHLGFRKDVQTVVNNLLKQCSQTRLLANQGCLMWSPEWSKQHFQNTNLQLVALLLTTIPPPPSWFHCGPNPWLRDGFEAEVH